MKAIILLLLLCGSALAKPAVDISIKNRNLLSDGEQFRNDPQNLAALQARVLIAPIEGGFLDINGYSYLDYSDTSQYVIDNSHYSNSRIGIHYTQNIYDFNYFLGTSGSYQFSDSLTRGVKFLDTPVNKKYESYFQAGIATPHNYAHIKSYVMYEGYTTQEDEEVSFASSYNVVHAETPELPGKFLIGMNGTLKPVLSPELENGDSVYADYYEASAYVSRKNNLIKGLDITLGMNGDYGSQLYSDKWISSGISYNRKVGNHRLFTNFFNDYSTDQNIVYKQELELGIFRNLLTEKMNRYGYKAMVRLIDKRGTLSYMSRLQATLFMVHSLYCTPVVYGYLNTMTKELTTRESLQLGYKIKNGIDVYCKPQFEYILTNSYDTNETNWYITSGMQFTF